MSETHLDLGAYRTQIAQLEWIQARRDELKDMEAEARAIIEELLPSVRTDGENAKVVGLLDGKPYIEWKPTKSRRLNQAALKEGFPKVVEFCTDTVYGRSMHVIGNKE